MELIRSAIQKSKSVYGNDPRELLNILEYYYGKDHFRAWVVATLLLEMDLSQSQREEIELKLCISTYYCGMHRIGSKYAQKLLTNQPDSPIFQYNANCFEESINKSYDYCLYIWEGGYQWFIDIARALKWKLEQEGHSVIISEQFLPGTKTIIFGANRCVSGSHSIPSDAIIYNLEHLYDGSPWDHPEHRKILERHEIWDFSNKNITWLKDNGLGKEIKHVKINYAPTLEYNSSLFLKSGKEDIDVLFVGWLNGRRQAIYNQLKELTPELNIVFTSNSWGVSRDELIARSKVILNIHYHETGILETPRVSYMVANKKFVISESSLAQDEQEWPGVVFVPHEKIAETALLYINQPDKRSASVSQAYNHFKNKELATSAH